MGLKNNGDGGWRTRISAEDQVVVLADRNSIFTMDMDDQISSNGFRDLSVVVHDTEEALMNAIPRLKPTVLVLGDLGSNWSDHEDKSASGFPYPSRVPFLNELLETHPELFVVNVRAMPDRVDELNQDRITSLDKPVTEKELMDVMDELLESKHGSKNPA